jgi:hypothetical protein
MERHTDCNQTRNLDGSFFGKVGDSEAVAVIGLSLRFPQDASSPAEFWNMLMEGKSARTEVPKDRYHVYPKSSVFLIQNLNS